MAKKKVCWHYPANKQLVLNMETKLSSIRSGFTEEAERRK